MSTTKQIIILISMLLTGCTGIQRLAHMHSDKAPEPKNYTYQDGGKSIYYSFITSENKELDTYVFFYGGSGCPSWKSVMPDYANGLSVAAKVFVLNKQC